MKFLFLMSSIILGVSVIACGIPETNTETIAPSFSSDFQYFSFIFRYAINPDSPNELNTATGTFTKDMVLAPSVSTELILNDNELARIYNKMKEIGFWSYPDVFTVENRGSMNTVQTPYERFYFRVDTDGTIKELYWDNKFLSNDSDAVMLRSLIQLIKDIIFAKPEYQVLPKASGAYA